MAVLLGVAVVSNVTVPSWQSFDAMTGFLVIITELAIGIGAGLILTIWFSSALLAGEKIATSSGSALLRKLTRILAVRRRLSRKSFRFF